MPLWLLLIDANKFKAINDTYGHIQGDAALERIAEALRLACKGLRRRASVTRYGGDEFVVLAWEEEPGGIASLRERIREALDALNQSADSPYELTVSIGVARAAPDKTLKALIAEADHSLYAEKNGGSSRHS